MIIFDFIISILDQLLDLIGIYNHIKVARVAAAILIIKIIAIGFLVLLASTRRLQRLWHRRHDRQKASRYRAYILDYLFAETDNLRENIFKDVRSQTNSSMEEGFFRRLLQDQFRLVRGLERERAVRLYKDLGFLRSDLRQAKSWFWWVRLAAAVRLERLEIPELTEIFETLMKDKSELVALVGIRGASKLNVDEAELLEIVSRRAPARRDIFIEILFSIADRNVDRVIQYLVECYDPFIASLCIEVLGERRVASVIPILRALLASSNDEVLAASAVALAQMRDQESMPLIKELLQHANPVVRAKSLWALIQFREESFESLIKELEKEKSVEVQRVIFDAKIQLKWRALLA